MTTVRILLPCPPRTEARAWGDWYFCHSLGDALTRLGCHVRYSYQTRPHRKMRPLRWLERGWTGLVRRLRRDEVELVVRGGRYWSPVKGKTQLLWLISQSGTVTEGELSGYAHVFVASPTFLERIRQACKGASLLYQCTDASRFVPVDSHEARLLYVGNRRRAVPRDIVRRVIEAGLPLTVWGRGWEEILPKQAYAGLHIENTDLPRHYGAARAVLNDHTDDMRRDGFVSNRVYDVLACGTPLVTERMSGLPEGLAEHLHLYGDEAECLAQLRDLAERAPDPGPLRALADRVRNDHSFDARARDILAVISQLSGQPVPSRPGVAAL